MRCHVHAVKRCAFQEDECGIPGKRRRFAQEERLLEMANMDPDPVGSAAELILGYLGVVVPTPHRDDCGACAESRDAKCEGFGRRRARFFIWLGSTGWTSSLFRSRVCRGTVMGARCALYHDFYLAEGSHSSKHARVPAEEEAREFLLAY